MSRASSAVGEYVGFPVPQPGAETTYSDLSSDAPSSISGIGLSAYRMQDHPYGYILLSSNVELDHLLINVKILDIKADNIMFGIADDSVLSEFENNELQYPCPRKELPDGRIIYTSRELRMPKPLGAPILCDFGSAVMGDEEHSEDIQPDIYRAPEVILQASWSYSVDIWNVGCVVRDPRPVLISLFFRLTLSDLEPLRRGVAI